MTVTIDPHSGFCWGVVRTIDIAEEELAHSGTLCSLGEIIHNPKEIERLGKEGLKTISVGDLERHRGETILIRAHGEPPSTFEKARELGIRLIDATCPVVTKVQERIRKFHGSGFQIVIFGKRDHAEVIGLVGQTGGEAIVVSSPSDIDRIDCSRKTVLFSQTTMDKPTFAAIRDALAKRIKEFEVATFENEAIEFHAKDTICGQVSGREKKLREFAAANDVILFVAGRSSSKGKVLYDIVREANERTYAIEDEREIHAEWLEGCERIGITGATSTPQWVMEKVRDEVKRVTSS